VTQRININSKALRRGWCVLAVIVFGVVLAIRIRLLGIPLERDEGEYAYAGQLMLQGIPPYKLAYNMKFPGTYAAYALIMSIFGQTITGIHLGLLLVNAATVALVFLLGRKLLNSTAGIAAAASYAVLSVSPSVLGFAGHATHFVMLPVIGGTLLLFNHSDRQTFGRLFASGLLFGVGLLMKQPAVFFILFGAIYLVSTDIRRRLGLKRTFLRNLTFGAGALLPFGFSCLLLWYAGVFNNFWQLNFDLRGTADFYLQCKGRNRAWLGALDAGWDWRGCGFVGSANACQHSFSPQLPHLLSTGAMLGILFPRPLFYFRSSRGFTPCGRCNQQAVRSSGGSDDGR